MADLDGTFGPVLASARFEGVRGPRTRLLMSTFVIDLSTLPKSGGPVEAEAVAQDLGLSNGEWPGTVSGRLRVERAGDRVTVRGGVSATAHLECVRCLREFDLAVEAPVVVLAERSGTSDPREEEALVRDEYMLFHDGRRLDLRETVRESLLLELPISPHCREDCPGLCPKCGADLNEGVCGCSQA